MLKRLTIILVVLFSLTGKDLIVAQEKSVNIYSGITEYLKSIDLQPVDTLILKADALISSTTDPVIQSKIAGIIFNYYLNSPIMGYEAVAVYLADNYFLNKKLKWLDDSTYPLLYTFAEFNRESLIGMDAQDVFMEDINGYNISLRNSEGEYKVVYFYDDKCSSCMEQTPQLVTIAKNYSGEPISIFAIYTQSNKEDWEKYVQKYFSSINNPNVTIYNLWDPEAKSSFHKKYSVLSTPSMTLIDWNNHIIGRKLNCEALAQMLKIKNNDVSSYRALFLNVFQKIDNNNEYVTHQIIDAFYEKSKNNQGQLQETLYELYKFLKTSPDYENQKSAVYLAEKYFLGKPELWSHEIIEEIKFALEMFHKNQLGTKATDLKLANYRGHYKSILKYKSDYTILYFHLVLCKDCQTYKKNLTDIYNKFKNKGIKIISIYVGDNEKEWKKYVKNNDREWIYFWDKNGDSDMHTKYDIHYVPKIYLLDKNKTIIAKDIDTSTLNILIEKL